MTRRALAMAAVLLAAGPPARAAAPDTVRVAPEVSPAVTRIGERVTVTVRVPVAEGERLVGPPAPGSYGELEVVDSGPAPAGPDSAAWRAEVAMFETGDHDVSVLPFALRSPEGERPVALAPYTVSVESVLPDSLRESAGPPSAGNLRPIPPPMDVPARWSWSRIGVLLLAVGLAIAGVLWWLRRPPATVIRAAGPRLSPEEAALRQLRDLAREAFPRRGRMKEHYSEISMILRAYVEARLDLPAVESTTLEIRDRFDRGSRLTTRDVAELLSLLEEADLVKFARQDPGSDAAESALEAATSWVERVGKLLRPPVPASGAVAEGGGA